MEKAKDVRKEKVAGAATDKEKEEHVIEKKSKSLYWLRLGFYSFVFLLFFFFTALVLYILPTNDTYQSFIDTIRDITVIPMAQIYGYIVPSEFWHHEAVYITAAIILMFFTVGLLCANDSFKNFLFGGSLKRQFATQLLIFFALLIAYLRLFQFLPTYIFNILTPIFILIGAMITWLLFQTVALFRYSRRYASSAEGFLLKHDNIATYSLVATSTFWGLIIIGGLGYGYYIILDIAKTVVKVETDLWLLLTLILGGVLVICCIAAFIISVASKTKKRERIYDNFSIMATNITLWPYILLNLAIYFFLTSSIVSSKGGGLGGRFLSITDLAISVATLIISMRGIGGKTDWKFGPLKRESFILTIYSAIAGQYGIRYLIFRQQLIPFNTGDAFSLFILYYVFVEIGGILPLESFLKLILLPNFPLNPVWPTYIIDPRLEFFVNMGNLITSIAVVGLLIGALVYYGARPEKFGQMFRIQEVGAKAGRATTDFIYNLLKEEFVRRKYPFPLSEVQNILAGSIELDINTTLRLVNKAELKYDDLIIDGMKKRYVYFT